MDLFQNIMENEDEERKGQAVEMVDRIEAAKEESENLTSPLLISSGFSTGDENFVECWLKTIQNSEIDYKFLTNGIIYIG